MIDLRVTVGLMLALAPSRAGAQPEPRAPWTQVVVLAGEFADAITQLEKVRDAIDPAQDSPTIVLQDPPGHGDSYAYRARYCPRDLRTAEGCALGGAEPIPLSAMNAAWQDEVNLSEPETLTSLLRFVDENYPSDRLLLVLKGRSGFGEALRDDDAQDGLDLFGLRRALDDALSSRGAPVDVLVLATSSSATIETAAALTDVVGIMVATQESVSSPRSVYFRVPVWRAILRDEPTILPRDLGRRIALNYRDPSYGSFDPTSPWAVSVLDLSLIPAAVDLLAADFAALSARGDAGVELLEAAGDSAWHFGNTETRADLGGLLRALSDRDAAAEEPLGLRSRLALKSALIETLVSDGDTPTGLSIFYPADPATQFDLRAEYRQRFGPFPAASGWLDLLRARIQYHRARAPSCAGAEPTAAPGLALLAFWLSWRRHHRRRGRGATPHRDVDA